MTKALTLRYGGDYLGTLPAFQAAVQEFDAMGSPDSANLAAFRKHDAYLKTGEFEAAVAYRTDTLVPRLRSGNAHARGLLFHADAQEARQLLEIDRLLTATDSSYALLKSCCVETDEFIDAASGSATLLVHFGRTEEALAQGEEAVAVARRRSAFNPRMLGIALHNLALAEQVASRYDASARHFGDAYRELQTALPHGHHLRASMARSAAVALLYIDRYDQALVYLREALAETNGDTSVLRASVLGEYADFLQGIGAVQDARYMMERAVGAIEAVGSPYGDAHNLVIEFRLRFASLLLATGESELGKQVLEVADTGIQGVADPISREVMSIIFLSLRAEYALAEGRFAEALTSANQAVELQDKHLESGTESQIEYLTSLAEAELATGNVTAAVSTFRRALAIDASIESEGEGSRRDASIGLIQAELALGHGSVARKLARDLLAATAARQLQRPNGLTAIQVATAFVDIENAAPGTIDPGRWTQIGRLIQDALRLPGVISATFASRAGVADDLSIALRKGAVAAGRECERGLDADACTLAFELADLSHAVRLQERSRRARGAAVANVPDSLLARSRELDAAILAWNQMEAAASRRALALDSLYRERALHEDHLRLTYPSYYQAYAAPVVDVDSLSASSGQSDRAYVTFVIDEAEEVMVRLTLYADGISARSMPYDAGLREDLSSFRALVDRAGETQELARVAHRLYAVLFAGAPELNGNTSMAIAEGRGAMGLPWGALLTAEVDASTPMSQWPWLASQVTLSYADAFRNEQLRAPRAEVKFERRIAGIVPGFEEASVKFAGGQGVDRRPSRTPWSTKLVDWLADQYQAQALTGGEATEANVLAAAHQAEVLHLGTHGFLDDAEPLRSYLALASLSAAQEEDGRLHAYEIYPRSIASRLAVLPACHSGQGAYTEEDGALSLATAVRAAGCPTVVQSLWAVDDAQTNVLLQNFYTRLFEGEISVAQAMREAQVEYLAEVPARFQHPYYWAGLSVVGVDQRFAPAPHLLAKWMPWGAAGLLLLVGGFWLAVRRRRTGRDA